MATRRALFALLVLAVGVAGCRLVALGVPCEADANCRPGFVCLAGECRELAVVVDGGAHGTRDGGGAGPDGGAVDADGGAPPSDGGPATSDAGLPLDDGGAGVDAGSVDAGPPEGCVDVGLAAAEVVGDVVVLAPADLALLDGVERVVGNVYLYAVDLGAAQVFPALLEITGRLDISADVDGGGVPLDPSFPCLQRVGYRLDVEGAAWDAPSFPALVTVGNDVQLEEVAAASFPRLVRALDLELHRTALTDLSAFPALRVLDDDINFVDNAALASVAELAGLEVADGRITLSGQTALTSLEGIAHLVPGEGRLEIVGSPALAACEAEEWRDRLVRDHGARDHLQLVDNDDTAPCPAPDGASCSATAVSEADACTGLELPLVVASDATLASTTTCTGSLTIGPGAQNICASSLVQVTGDLYVDAGGTLTSLRLPALRRVTGNVYIVANGMSALDLRRLRSANAVEVRGDESASGAVDVYLPSLESAASVVIAGVDGALVYLASLGATPGGVVLEGNPAVVDVHLPWLTSVGGELRIFGHAALASVEGLSRLQSVAGSLLVGSNASLAGLDALDQLTAVGGTFGIRWNDALVDLPPASMTVGNAVVTDNPCLPAEEAAAWTAAVTTISTLSNNGASAPCPAP